MVNILLFMVLPYTALLLAVIVGIVRYQRDRFSYSSLSSQFLEKQQLFYGSIPWHYGILLILTAHLLAALFPGLWSGLLGSPVRLYVLEITGLGLAALSVFGLVTLMARRAANPRIQVVSTVMDWVLLADLLVQVVAGLLIAFVYRWGAVWYLNTAVPWLWSLVRLQPDVQTIATLPWLVKLHMANAFVLVGLFPFTRLVHVVTVPIGYLWRPYQVVVWNRRPAPSADAHS